MVGSNPCWAALCNGTVFKDLKTWTSLIPCIWYWYLWVWLLNIGFDVWFVVELCFDWTSVDTSGNLVVPRPNLYGCKRLKPPPSKFLGTHEQWAGIGLKLETAFSLWSPNFSQRYFPFKNVHQVLMTRKEPEPVCAPSVKRLKRCQTARTIQTWDDDTKKENPSTAKNDQQILFDSDQQKWPKHL